MIVDEKGRLFGKINLIDLLVLLVLLAAIAFGVYKFALPKTEQTASQTVELKFYAEEVSDFVASNVKIGEPVVDANTMVEFGNVKSVEVGPSQSYASTSDGRFVMGSKEKFNSVMITTEAEGTITPHGCQIKGNEYGIGHSLTIRAGKAKIYLRVYDVQAKEQ